MMTESVQLMVGNCGVGVIEFPRPAALTANRTIDGLAVTIPTQITIDGNRHVENPALLSNLRAAVKFRGLEIGLARDDRFYAQPQQGDAGNLILRMSAAAVHQIENKRAGAGAEFEMNVEAEICTFKWPDQGPPEGLPIRMTPHRVHGTVHVVYERDAWANMINGSGFGENVVVEIPLPSSPGEPWDPIWQALRTARVALQQGGETGWKSAIVECRHALEKWNNEIEEPNPGPGWQKPGFAELKARTKEQRRDALRWHLLQCAHEAAHTPADRWAREDAVLVLACLSALVGARHP